MEIRTVGKKTSLQFCRFYKELPYFPSQVGRITFQIPDY
jgi:hypothetical protein